MSSSGPHGACSSLWPLLCSSPTASSLNTTAKEAGMPVAPQLPVMRSMAKILLSPSLLISLAVNNCTVDFPNMFWCKSCPNMCMPLPIIAGRGGAGAWHSACAAARVWQATGGALAPKQTSRTPLVACPSSSPRYNGCHVLQSRSVFNPLVLGLTMVEGVSK